jgi:hypothetical protein
MPLLIDGHNLIGQMPGLDLADSDDEAQLVLLLRQYAARKRGRRIVVVFDHGVYGHPQNLNGYNVECHFAKSPRDADKLLIRRIRAIRRVGEWQVITSDRAVAGEARARNIKVISSSEFARKLQASAGPTVRPDNKSSERPLSPREVDEWMQIFGIDPEEEEPEDPEEPGC